jgi:hypothetical protein
MSINADIIELIYVVLVGPYYIPNMLRSKEEKVGLLFIKYLLFLFGEHLERNKISTPLSVIMNLEIIISIHIAELILYY